eukprot:Plantae.Rhodophyta-Rhodochaete_pulchella.ctg8545.p2 GENE.Plantae.Rhodophyta-Rhodochaete_pulchella.ctg8545~~Plantae.Rhodophyta-Rhodochaete_pulchella.ctg8545.p2  ORF type:complete len:135 (+),score=28.35 Plantae.Rhodophyta-Rhodochaete_pulchella.ctg8545:559-963(+)
MCRFGSFQSSATGSGPRGYNRGHAEDRPFVGVQCRGGGAQAINHRTPEADAAAARGIARPSADISGDSTVEDESAGGDPMDIDGPNGDEDDAGRLNLEEQTRLGVSIRLLKEEELIKMEPKLNDVQDYWKKNEE